MNSNFIFKAYSCDIIGAGGGGVVSDASYQEARSCYDSLHQRSPAINESPNLSSSEIARLIPPLFYIIYKEEILKQYLERYAKCSKTVVEDAYEEMNRVVDVFGFAQ